MAETSSNATSAKPQQIKEEKPKATDEKKYAIFSKESIKTMAESAGHERLSEETAAILAEDVCYRLREAVQASSQFMKHSKRKRMTSDDFNKALRWSDVEPIHGYGSNEPAVFRQIKDTNLYFVEDRDLSLPEIAMDTKIPNSAGNTSLKANWLALEGVHKTVVQSSDPGQAAAEGIQKILGVQGQGMTHSMEMLSSDQVTYYQHIVKAILGTDEEATKVVLVDLQTNSKIAGLLPYLVNFVSVGVKVVSLELYQLTGLLYIIDALVRNQFIYLGPYMIQLVSTVMYCILEPLAVSINPINDHWGLRDYAARLLLPILRCSKESKNKFYHQMLTAFQEVMNDPARPLCTYYGAVMGLIALGPQAVEDVLCPRLSSYWVTLQQILEDTSITRVKEDGHKVHGALLTAAETLLRHKYHKGEKETDLPSQTSSPCDSPRNMPEFAFGTASYVTQLSASSGNLTPHLKEKPPRKHNNFMELYSELYSYFGDSLSVRLGIETDALQVMERLDKHMEHTASLQDLVNERVTFDGTMFRQRHVKNAGKVLPIPSKPRTVNTELPKTTGKIPSKSPGQRFQTSRTRHGKMSKRSRSRSGGLRDIFQIVKPVKPLSKKTHSIPLESKVWRINLKMPHVGKRKKLFKRVGMPPTKNLPSIHAVL
ncbi:TAF6-like RNA polymerase II p300/CBP-associated factor-associated factor 65 kDa subunit 6L [Lytechinus variegatus]|uniref:TAF6-like RNA polymerase II p300/CBP-associated factor-associated factor 65 kDa subunit 6L n=1 Tax=Lytechinus variegatus TaxID=7654 RepID=UPI001BB263C7|nr:TAF6-like RNA polymerase II p300/CBP-associated factor-associated factor 65 kDa subunit 6L [Lytechinus variegatus]